MVGKFEEIVQRYKDKVAVKSSRNALTYGELNCYANRAAHVIVSRYQAPDLQENKQTVALLFNNGIEAVAAVLAVLKAGKIYVPLGTGFPVKRLAGMVEHFDIRMILTDSRNKFQCLTSKRSMNRYLPGIRVSRFPVPGTLSLISSIPPALQGHPKEWCRVVKMCASLPTGISTHSPSLPTID